MGQESDAIKAAVDIRDVVELYGVTVNNRGVCTCPFHDDHHPSASIGRGKFHCWVCDLHLDIFSFVMQMTGCNFKQAMIQINSVFRVVDDLDKPLDGAARANLSRIRREKEQKQREREARNAEYDRRTAEYNHLFSMGRPDAQDVDAMGRYAAGLGRIQQMDYWFDNHKYESW